jgi:serine/threonine protein kinase
MIFNEGNIYNKCMNLLNFPLFIFSLDLLKEELGGGGFGDVYKVEKISTKEELVMKVIKLGKEDKKNSKGIEAEIQVGINLGSSCKYLVKLTDFFKEGGYCCLIMEYCNGGDLEKVLKEGKRIEQPVFFLIILTIILYFEGVAKNYQ